MWRALYEIMKKLLLLTILILSSNTYACKCGGEVFGDDKIKLSWEKSIAVMAVQITEAKLIPNEDYSKEAIHYKFNVIDTYKKPAEDIHTIVSTKFNTSCTYGPMSVSGEYILFLYPSETKGYAKGGLHSCGSSIPYRQHRLTSRVSEHAQELIKKLKGFK